MNEMRIERRDGPLPSTSSSGADAIARQIRDAIAGGTYVHGQRLPAERHLASHFNTSRSTIREAMKLLGDLDIVDRRPGSGTFVNYREAISETHIADMTSPFELIEVREAIEPQLARLAVAHASARSLEALEAALRDLRNCGHEQEAFSAADERFHLALASASGNPLMNWLYEQINKVRARQPWGEMKRKILTPTNIDLYNRSHQEIFDALCQRDIGAAVEAVDRHMSKVRADLLGASHRSTDEAHKS